MASGRELSYLMLLGASLCYIVTFVLVGRPSSNGCAASRVLIGISMSAMYAAILVKTNRLARVFKLSTPVRPRFISPLAQLGLCGGIMSVQLAISFVSLFAEPPAVYVHHPTRTEAVLTCTATTTHLLVSLLLNAVLVVACTFYAVKTRLVPDEYCETRYIGFTVSD